jgi:hypothetical protein
MNTIGLDGVRYWSELTTISYNEAVKGLIAELQSNDDIDIENLSVAIHAITGVEIIKTDGNSITFYTDNL